MYPDHNLKIFNSLSHNSHTCDTDRLTALSLDHSTQHNALK